MVHLCSANTLNAPLWCQGIKQDWRQVKGRRIFTRENKPGSDESTQFSERRAEMGWEGWDALVTKGEVTHRKVT